MIILRVLHCARRCILGMTIRKCNCVAYDDNGRREREWRNKKRKRIDLPRVYILFNDNLPFVCTSRDGWCTPGAAKQSIAADFRVDHVGIGCRATNIIIIRSVIMEKKTVFTKVGAQSRSIFLVCRKRFGHAWRMRLVFDFTARPECFYGSNDDDRSYVCGRSAACQNVNRQRPSIVSSAGGGGESC